MNLPGFEGQPFNGGVGQINGPMNLPGIEEPTFNGPVVVNQPSPPPQTCNCPDQSQPGKWICFKGEPQCQCKPLAVYHQKNNLTNVINAMQEELREASQIANPSGSAILPKLSQAEAEELLNYIVIFFSRSASNQVGKNKQFENKLSTVTNCIKSGSCTLVQTYHGPLDTVTNIFE